MACNDKLTADILKDCANKPVGGLEVDVLLFNREDVDYSSLAYDATNTTHLLTDFVLNSGATGYVLEGIKQSNGALSELVIKDFGNFYKHGIAGAVLAPSAANLKTLGELLDGGSYVAIVERKWKGASSADAFVVLGLDSGLVASSRNWNSKENDGIVLFEMASEEGYEEPKSEIVLLDTDYATTKTAFDNKFANP